MVGCPKIKLLTYCQIVLNTRCERIHRKRLALWKNFHYQYKTRQSVSLRATVPKDQDRKSKSEGNTEDDVIEAE